MSWSQSEFRIYNITIRNGYQNVRIKIRMKGISKRFLSGCNKLYDELNHSIFYIKQANERISKFSKLIYD